MGLDFLYWMEIGEREVDGDLGFRIGLFELGPKDQVPRFPTILGKSSGLTSSLTSSYVLCIYLFLPTAHSWQLLNTDRLPRRPGEETMHPTSDANQRIARISAHLQPSNFQVSAFISLGNCFCFLRNIFHL